MVRYVKEEWLNYFGGVPSTFYEGMPTPGQVVWNSGGGTDRWMDLASTYVLCRLISSGPVFQSSMGENHNRENEGLVYSRPERVRGASEQEDRT